ncbi:hypothetical protein [Spiroplasma sp. BIUS-1]|uniref:hypothetical protein n=1 Tax=Spiroplasma sp. BIUS-1 TaxID=216964 RepID=UPI001396DAC4|nr:hypothetical protein [Spiroplasma sp. BIUS-1]QHX36861.1 hypothetical protein SBIUS_v1c06080 [Spiroplasma sp. BIUS-1]
MKALLTTKKFNKPAAFFAFSTLSFKNMFFKDNAKLGNKMAMFCAPQHMAQWS